MNTSLPLRYSDDLSIEIGIDEAGRGPMFGRVYAAAVILPAEDSGFRFDLMKDSKKFTSEKKIADAAAHIKDGAAAWAVEWCDEKTIDKENIRNATFLAMHKCIKTILSKLSNPDLSKTRLLVDGNGFKPFVLFDASTGRHSCAPHVCVTQGDNSYCAIAAASILAKTERDLYIETLCDSEPKLDEFYSIRKNKGYGTKIHLEGISEHGLSPWHRRSYGICKNALICPEFKCGSSQQEHQQSRKNN